MDFEMAWSQFLKRRKSYVEMTEQREAAIFAQCVELQILKAPSTAKFPDLSEMVVEGASGHYIVSGYVDAQNGYGAMVREKYTYHIEKDSNGRWNCTDKFASPNKLNLSLWEGGSWGFYIGLAAIIMILAVIVFLN